ncbi:LysR family transcriptional regulator [Devosia sp. YIM 151766]|uniref:LysR family transcriptional regulator n=1 Tax=Devosia sp. YIM 151766 TaxID=3017325 RepID=UPI00255CA79D|nr:LysR family transcriptional regulator [Devosia sp. YIM 151766]WIY53041.1 LysR family transcriptional regulator [Devosia sp. YIM 151766]
MPIQLCRLGLVMDLTWLSDFAALAKTGNFSRAAETRNVTQPAFSRRIRLLEEWIGQPLVDRRSHPIVLTPAGQAFRTYAEELPRRVEEGRQAARMAGQQQHQTLRFATTQVLSLSFFPIWLRSIATQTALGAVNLISNSVQACEQSMLQGEAQFLLCHYLEGMPWRLTDDAFMSTCIRTDRLIPVSALGPDGKPLYSMDASSNQTIPLLAYDGPAGLGRIFRSVFDIATVRPRLEPIAESHLALLLGLALEGRGVAWVPEGVVRAELDQKLLGEAGGPKWSIPMEVRLFRPRSPLGQVAEEFWKFVLDTQDPVAPPSSV